VSQDDMPVVFGLDLIEEGAAPGFLLGVYGPDLSRRAIKRALDRCKLAGGRPPRK
jgi:hypothetical protein